MSLMPTLITSMKIQKLQQTYDKGGYHSSPSDTMVFQEDTITLELEEVDEDTAADNDWKMTPINKLEVNHERDA